MQVTFEKLLKKIPNPYQLAVVASKRAVALALGATPMIKTRNHKPASIALEEIYEGKVSLRVDESDKA